MALEITKPAKVNSIKKIKTPYGRIVPIVRQPVTVVKSQPGSKSKQDLKHGPSIKPQQIFWQKRLEGLRATNANSEFVENFDLPKNMKPVGPNVGPDTALRSVITSLYLNQGPIIGQTAGRNILEKNPGVFLDPKQPLVATVIISDEDIKRQEERVNLLRRKVANALLESEQRRITER